MGSTRLPGKILKPILGKPMLAHEIERLKTSKKIDSIILATTDKVEDNATAALGKECGILVFRGSEEDVLDRYYHAAKEASADVVVRVTGDCPLHGGAVIDEVVEHFLNVGVDYSIYVPEGLDTEVFTFAALERAWKEAKLPSEREHVTLYIQNHPEIFHLDSLWSREWEPLMHWSVDSQADFNFITKIYEALYPSNPLFTKDDVLAFLREKPALLEINKGGTGYEGLAKSLVEDDTWKLMRRLVLGTVELGMAYGLDSDIPQPSKAEAFAILDASYKAGIRMFDTASAYGSAEALLGEWLASRKYTDMKIISKGSGMSDIRQSLERLRIASIEDYLLHNEHGSKEELEAAKRSGLVAHIGASIYEPTELQEWLECVQVPYNALDRRFENISQQIVFARSPFLQGLLLQNPTQLPTYLAHARPYLEAFSAVAKKFSLSKVQAALLFALHAQQTYYVVFGVKTLAQLEEIIAAAKMPLPVGYIEAVHALPVPPADVYNPTLWQK